MVCRKLVRPYRDGVDIVMTDDNITYLVEAKGSASSKEDDWVENKLGNEYLVEMVRETLSSYGIDVRAVKGILIGVYLEDELNYNCYITEINIIDNNHRVLDNNYHIHDKKSFKIFTQIKVLVYQICRPERLDTLSKEEINADVEMEISEIIKIYMREISKKAERAFSDSHQLINEAITKAKEIFQHRLVEIESQKKLAYLDKYLETAKKNLTRKPSKSNKLSFAKSLVETAEKELLFTQMEIELRTPKENDLFQILINILKKCSNKKPELKLIKPGFDNYIEGLLIYPLLDELTEYRINFTYLDEGFYTKKIYNFPVEIYYEEFTFIADDDGSIFVSVENLPSESFLQAGQLLIKLAMQLYGYTEF